MANVVRACVLLGVLASAGAGAAAPIGDASCLVQAHTGVALHGNALRPELSATLHAVAKQLPFEMPGAMGKFSMEQMMSVGMDFLALLKNKTIADSMDKGMGDMTVGLLAYSSHLTGSVKDLSATAKNATNKAEALSALSDYLTSQNLWFAKMSADFAMSARRFARMLPAGSLLSNMTKPMLEMMESMTRRQVKSFIFTMLNATTMAIVGNQTTFCERFAPLYGNLSSVSTFMTTKSAAMLESMEAMLPQVMPMVEGFAPEAAPKLSAMMNKSVDNMGKVMAAYRESLPLAVSTLTEVAEGKLGCSLSAHGSERSAAAQPAKAHRGFVLAAAAVAAAWALLA